jgi:flagellin
MGFRINTNVPSMAAQRTLEVKEKLKASVRSTNQANRNANDGISMIQTAEGGLNEISNILIRMRELAMQSASDTVGDSEREFTDLEYQNLKQEIERISQVTEFNGKKLLNGEGDSYDFQIGINNDEFQDRIRYNANLTNSTIAELKIDELAINSKEGSQSSLSVVDAALQDISGSRAELGAVQNRLTSTVQNLQVTSENLNAANSRIRDTDYASETAKNTKLNILTQAGTSVLSQANQSATAALKLLG